MFKPNAATFTTPIRIQHKTLTNVNGAPKPTWSDATDPVAFVNWKGKGGTEKVTAGVLTIEDTAELTMWYRSDVSEMDRVYKNDDATQVYEVLNVEDIEERRLYLLVKVKRVKAG